MFSETIKVSTLTDKDLQPGKQIVEMAIDAHEVSFNNLQLTDFKITREEIRAAGWIIYCGKLGEVVLKGRHKQNSFA